MDHLESPPLTQQKQPQQPTNPLEIPEILYQIFPFVSDRTLCYSVPLVNRQWLTLSRPLILRTVRWAYEDRSKSDAIFDERLRRLEFANRLEIEFNHIDSAVKWYWMAESVARARLQPEEKKKKPAEEEDFLKEPLLLKKAPLRELSIVGWGASYVLARMFVCLGSLTHLEVMVNAADRWSSHREQPQVDLMGFFSCCPLLQSLRLASVRINSPPTLGSPWVPVETSPEARRIHFSSQHLESLVIEGFVFFHKDLEELLSVSPRMKVLKIINRESSTRYGSSMYHRPYSVPSDRNYSAKDLCKHLDRIGLILETFHYSNHYFSWCNLDHAKEIQRFSKSKEWTFIEGDLSPKLVQELLTIPNVVTTLELLNVTNTFVFARGLHTYLCASPHLIHLRAAKTPYPVKFMDVHSNYLLGQPMAIEPSSSTSSGGEQADSVNAMGETGREEQRKNQEKKKHKRKGIWMCRNLKTLHLGFMILSEYCKRDSINARIIFGYLTRVCPLLEELHLHSKDCRQPTPFHTLRLRTGFCLLSRLQHLRQLHIGTFDAHLYAPGVPQRVLDENAFFRNWMFIGRKDELRLKKAEESYFFLKAPYDRRSEVTKWNKKIVKDSVNVLERNIEKMNLARMEPGATDTAEEGSQCDQEGEEMGLLRVQLSTVGLWHDVWEMVKEMDTTPEFVSCPSLEQFRIYSPREYGSFPTF